jgi:peptide/nickel transport system permease protein
MTVPATDAAAPGPAPSPAPASATATRHTWLQGQRDFWRRFARHRDGVLGIIVLVFFTVMAIAPGLFVGPLETVTTASGNPLEAPSALHIFGTDELGRDILNLTIHGARISMVIGLLATVITIILGALIGISSGFIGGRTDSFLMRITDFFLVLPTFVLALVLAPIILDIVGESSEIAGIRMTLIVIVIVIGITSWASTARIIRSQALSVKERMFVDRARVIGSGSGHIMRRHILPNVTNLIVANTVLVFGGAILTETTLAFVGLGDPFAPSWGQILNSAETQGAPTLGAWWYILPPATCIVLVVLSFTLVGGALDSVLNPRLRRRR